MPLFETKNFGQIPYELESTIEFPVGLPGFEDRRRFVALHFDGTDPLVYLQSVEEPGLCFITMPVLAVDPQYQLVVSGEDLALVGLPSERQPRIGEEIACLTVLSIREGGPTANLLAPVVVNLGNLKAVQAVAPQSAYSHRHVLVPQEAAVCS